MLLITKELPADDWDYLFTVFIVFLVSECYASLVLLLKYKTCTYVFLTVAVSFLYFCFKNENVATKTSDPSFCFRITPIVHKRVRMFPPQWAGSTLV